MNLGTTADARQLGCRVPLTPIPFKENCYGSQVFI